MTEEEKERFLNEIAPGQMKLEGREIVPCTRREWSEFWGSKDRIIKQETVGDCWVSTVFLGINHGWSGKDLWFETMVFETGKDGKRDMGGIYQDRCSTYDEAEAMHAKAVAWVQDGCQDEDNIHNAIGK